jgi:sec-independent protein translocase protein TatA
MTPLFAFLNSPQDWLIVIIVGFIVFVLFGKRMPEVGRSLGKGIMEFKKGIKGLEDDPGDNNYHAGTNNTPQQEAPRPPQRITSSAPKFDEPTNPDAPPRI